MRHLDKWHVKLHNCAYNPLVRLERGGSRVWRRYRRVVGEGLAVLSLFAIWEWANRFLPGQGGGREFPLPEHLFLVLVLLAGLFQFDQLRSDLSRAREYCDSILASTSLLVYTLSPALTLTGANLRWDRLAEEVGGASWKKARDRSVLDFLGPLERIVAERVYRLALQGHPQRCRLPYPAAGAGLWLTCEVSPLLDRGGKATGLLVVGIEPAPGEEAAEEARAVEG